MNASLWTKPSPGAAPRNEALRACKGFGRRLWKQWSDYYRRSLMKTKIHCFTHLGELVSARMFDLQVVELHVRIALLNRFNQVGRPQTVPVAVVA